MDPKDRKENPDHLVLLDPKDVPVATE